MQPHMKSKDIKFLLSEKEKYQKNSNQGSDAVKNLWHYYNSIGESQIMQKAEKYRKLKNLRKGVIDIDDYVSADVPEELQFDMNDRKLEDIKLTFHPLTPVISNGIIGDYNTKHIKYIAKAINPENTNDIIESFNTELRDLTISKLENLFLAENPNPDEEAQKMFQESEAVQDAYASNFRTTIEQWANHTLQKEDARFDMKHIERTLLEQIIENETPVIHVYQKDDIYYPEILEPEKCFWLKSPKNTDFSEGMMFGWYEDSTITGVLSKDADKLSDKDVKKLEKWGTDSHGGGFIINGLENGLTGNIAGFRESAHNYIKFKQIDLGKQPLDNNLIRRTTIYFLLPAKLYKVYDKDMNVQIFDENFKVTKKPKYIPGKPKTKEFLVSGEHAEAFYINELWKGEALNVQNTRTFYMDAVEDESTIWLSLERYDIQYSEDKYKFGVRIPVHGGCSDKLSITEMTAPSQISYNWIWNKNQQLLSTEIGKFFAVHEGAIAGETLDESWKEEALANWLTSGRDLSVNTVTTPLNHLGQPMVNTSIGQVVDLTKTQEILEKAQLARAIKEKCYEEIGLTPEFLYGNNSPQQTASSVAQGLQRTSSQIQHIHIRLHDVMRRTRTTMLETAQYIESKNPVSQVSYTSPSGARTIFEANTEGFLLHKLDIYIESSLSDADTLERIKQNALVNNTLGANTLEMATLQHSRSLPELFTQLRELEVKKRKELQEERQHNQQLQQELLQSKEKLQDQKLAFEERKAEREHEKDIAVAQIRAIGYGEGSTDEISKEILELQNANTKQQQLYDNLNYQNSLLELKGQDSQSKKDKIALEEKIKMKQLAQKDKELEIREKEVIASNKRTNAID